MLHKVGFIVWSACFAVHFLWYLPRAWTHARACAGPRRASRARGRLAAPRRAPEHASLGGGLALALVLLSLIEGWHGQATAARTTVRPLVQVLIIDDDRALRDALRRALTLAGYEVDTAAERRAGRWSASPSGRPTRSLLDVGMPGLDGLEVCRRLRAAGNRVPVLMLTARDAVEDRIDGLDAGADDYLVKPFDVGELKARLRALLRRANGDDGDAGRARRSRSSGSIRPVTASSSATASPS